MSNYSVESLKILKGLEAVKKRPGMYIGATDVNGLHHLVWEIVDNSIDEVLAGFAKNIKVILKNDGSVVVEDDGRGIPVGLHKETGLSGVELVFTELHAGGKFGESSGAYKTSGGLHGVGSSVVNALSDRLEVNVYKDGFEYHTIFGNGGEIIQKTIKLGPTSKRGTRVQFWPTYKIFKNAKLSYERIKERVRESSFLVSGVEVKVKDENLGLKEFFKSENGLQEFIAFINESKTTETSIATFKGISKDQIEVEVGFQYTNDYNELILSFVNNVKTRDGGEHVVGFKGALTKIINDYGHEQKLIKQNENLEGDDIREGITAIISLKIPESILEFVGQTKDKLRTPESKRAVEEIVEKQLYFWLQQNKKDAHTILNKALLATKARLAAQKAKKEARTIKQSINEAKILSGKLTPAQTKNPLERELFLVEGDSAGGSAKLGRDRKTQAILPLRGKVINVEKTKLIEILKNEEISTIINTVGAGVGNDFKIKDIQYGKIVIMTDADTDGAHIQTLLLTFLFRYMRPLIENGHVYIAQPPLYKITKKGGKNQQIIYAWNDEELTEACQEISSYEIQRYKGLGEMNAEQLWETTMNPATRSLIRVNIEDPAIAERRVSILMGDVVEPRKEWINSNVDFNNYDELIENKININSKQGE